MLKDFARDKAAAKPAEELVYNILSSLGYEVENVADQAEYRKRGDIKVILPLGEVFVDVKHDKRIADTYNILCEVENYIIDDCYTIDGDMRKNYDYMAIVSVEAGKIYFLDFKVLQQIYRKGEYKEIKHADQITICYLLPLGVARKYGAIKGVIEI